MNEIKYFLDTNILVYANDKTEKNKQQISEELILNGIKSNNIAISAQVLSEFWVVITKKIKKPLDYEDALRQIELFRIMDICEIDYDLVISAIKIQKQYILSYWDSLIISAAASKKCSVVYSEDMSDGHNYHGVKVINPFLKEST